MRLRFLWALVCIGCATAPGPDGVAESYARALRDNRLDDAYALTSAEFRARVSRKEFDARYRDAAARLDRASAITSSLGAMRARSAELEAVRENEGWRVAETASDEGPRQALTRFLDAADAGDFSAAYQLLAAPLRARYTSERLAQDFKAEPLSLERLSRARAALTARPVFRGDEASYPLGDGKSVRLVREGDQYRVAALE